MDFEWDEAKRQRTIRDRGLDFVDACRLFDGRPVIHYPSPRHDEDRIVTVGYVQNVAIAVVWTPRDAARRIISMRRARNAEERAYRALHP